MPKLLLWVIGPAMLALLYRNFRLDQQNSQQNRRHLLDDCVSLLQNAQLTQVKDEFPSLTGVYNGFNVSLELILDTLAVRKVPPLWLTVGIDGKRAVKGSLDVLVRPQNNEFYSPAWQWEGNLPVPAQWPAHSVIKYQQELASVDILSRFVPSLFSDERMKEILVLPNKLRLTYLAKQAARTEYMVLRNALIDATPIDKTQVEHLIQTAIEIRQALEMESNE